ncbi:PLASMODESMATA CALLOSE-BINDING PROTEIN 3 [Ricinus communis]|uniref:PLASMODESMATA CALLOSE-BINDING PROTEIN 3 n=1 Tax=Ricinus communis TaxID=3988 RepID=UPI00077272DD|nr:PLASMODESMATA CALLOSE-BINDING PROTEIN 3 [Ricinus communis]|eukprot:XP_015572031.1 PLASMODESMATA CALLOSE-BINDING PROTEIN 3 [Ricinus communis]
MAILVLAMLMLVMTGHASCTWCVCKEGSDAVLQKTLDYACGAGADCGPIHSNGPCFQPNTVRAHCSYAVNSYFQKKGQAQGSCDFSGTATASTTDPSYSGCSYPATLSAAGTSTTTTPTPVTTNPSTTTPSTTNPSNTTPTTTTPYSTTPSNGVLGGIGNGVSPTGAGINTDITDSGFRVASASLFSFFATLLVSGLMLLWG